MKAMLIKVVDVFVLGLFLIGLMAILLVSALALASPDSPVGRGDVAPWQLALMAIAFVVAFAMTFGLWLVQSAQHDELRQINEHQRQILAVLGGAPQDPTPIKGKSFFDGDDGLSFGRR
jgi:hypothetical protein